MTGPFEAIYEDGVLKPVRPLPLAEHAKVRVTIEPVRNWVNETAGMLGFKGTAEEADYLATDPDLDYPPPPEGL
jgi:predicted DNA-binding antitoxin AbrB/MazE fold protein